MKYSGKLRILLSVMLCALLLLAACGNVGAPDAATAAPDVPVDTAVPDGRVHVSTVDELLAAIGHDTAIYLEDGVFDLTAAADYGGDGTEFYHWNEVSDGYELVITGVSGLSLTGGLDENKLPVTSIVTNPRFANVLRFENCEDISIFGVVVGHSAAAGVCSGGVLRMTNVDDVMIEYCELFGCGTLALEAVACEEITVQNSVLRQCSVGAVSADRCRAVVVKLCEIYDCGDSSVFTYSSSADCAVLNSSIYENYAYTLVSCGYSKNINILGCTVRANSFQAGVFDVDPNGEPLVVAGCEFDGNTKDAWFGGMYGDEQTVPAVGIDGVSLTEADLEAMLCEYIEWSVPEDDDTPDPVGEVTVSTVDELLAAIAPNVTIRLADGVYDLSEASDYGKYGGRYYYWYDAGDGPELMISNAYALSIMGGGADKASIIAAPRYANVLHFEGCDGLTLSGFTAGHTEAGECSGGVLVINDSDDVFVSGCSLFGCGIIGIQAYECEDMAVDGVEIYDCSIGAVQFDNCENAAFTDMDIHDLPAGAYEYSLLNCENATVDGKAAG